MKTPKEYGVEAATIFNAMNPDHFPGRPLFEGLVASAVRAAVKEDRAMLIEDIRKVLKAWEEL